MILKELRILVVILVLSVLVIAVSPCVYAASFTCYATVNETSTVAGDLIGLYVNQPDYDPFNQYVICRTGELDYYLFYSKNLALSYSYINYHGERQTGYSTVWSYRTGIGEDLVINKNGFGVVGNVQGSHAFFKEKQFGFAYVIVVFFILISILFLFKTFRKVHRPRSDRGYTL